MDIDGASSKRSRAQEVVVETPGSQSSLHRANLERVVRAVRLAGSLTQAEIARSTGLSAATVSNIVRELKDGGTVEVTPTSAGGRRARSVSLSGWMWTPPRRRASTGRNSWSAA